MPLRQTNSLDREKGTLKSVSPFFLRAISMTGERGGEVIDAQHVEKGSRSR